MKPLRPRPFLVALLLAAALLVPEMLLPRPAAADGFNVASYFLRVGFNESPLVTAAIILGFMLANYALNALVVGLPAVRWGTEPAPRVARGLVAFTLLGQLADRVGAVLAVPVLALVLLVFGEGAGWVRPLLLCNFVLSGLAVALLAYRFHRRRWGVEARRARLLAVLAGIVTNPAWVLGLWLR